jgi:hypothetical protein
MKDTSQVRIERAIREATTDVPLLFKTVVSKYQSIKSHLRVRFLH